MFRKNIPHIVAINIFKNKIEEKVVIFFLDFVFILISEKLSKVPLYWSLRRLMWFAKIILILLAITFLGTSLMWNIRIMRNPMAFEYIYFNIFTFWSNFSKEVPERPLCSAFRRLKCFTKMFLIWFSTSLPHTSLTLDARIVKIPEMSKNYKGFLGIFAFYKFCNEAPKRLL